MRAVIVRTAHNFHVDPNLALAIGWQESGWQQDEISVASAVGAMQVMPATGRWLSTRIGRRLHIRQLHDNVTAGVYLLHLLRDASPLRTAVAGYYQGLSSVRARGMFPDTRRYVANVLALHRLFRHGHYPY